MKNRKLIIVLVAITVSFVAIFSIKTLLGKKNKVDVVITETSDIPVDTTEEDKNDDRYEQVEEHTQSEEVNNNQGANQSVEDEQQEQPVTNIYDEEVDTRGETSSKFDFISDNYKRVESKDGYDVYEHVFQTSLSAEQICTEEGFYEFLCEVNFNAGSLIEISCIDEEWKLYNAKYENAEINYAYNKNKLTLIKHTEKHD